jgi:hypothetical protein
MHWQQGVERKVEKSCIESLEPRACAFLLHFWLLGVRSAVPNQSDRFW